MLNKVCMFLGACDPRLIASEHMPFERQPRLINHGQFKFVALLDALPKEFPGVLLIIP